MTERIYNKLVRDRIPEIIEDSGKKHVTRKIEGEECKKALLQKLLEEGQEVVQAEGKEELEKEIGDVIEVLEAIIKAFNLDKEKIEEMKQRRREERGGFEEGFFLERAEE